MKEGPELCDPLTAREPQSRVVNAGSHIELWSLMAAIEAEVRDSTPRSSHNCRALELHHF